MTVIGKKLKDVICQSIKSNNPGFIFLAGSAGTGKTTLLKEMRQVFKDSVIVAPTGAAAINCDLITEEKNKEKKLHGITIHSFFKFYKKHWSSLERLSRGKNVSGEYKKVFERLELLIIDELSMVSAPLLDGISNSLIQIRKNPYPFGGLTILAAGDLCQLPPVIDYEQQKELKKLPYPNRYFFSSLVFKEVEQAGYFQAYELKENYRQSQDVDYFRLLDQFRKQENIEDVINQFNSSCLVDAIDKGVDLILGPKKNHVLSINEDRLGRLETQEKTFIATKRTGRYTRIKDENLPAPPELKLKVGARVMMIKNDTNRPQRWVNGTTGVIKALESNVIKVKIGKYVRNVARETWEEVKLERIEEAGEWLEVPIGDYKQFPITLGWAVTIHKAQGQTLDTCVIDLRGGTWEHGQLYVALSRCRKLEDLKLTRPIQKSDCHFDPDVTDFLDSVDFKELNDSESKQQEKTQTKQSDSFSYYEVHEILQNIENMENIEDGNLIDIDGLKNSITILIEDINTLENVIKILERKVETLEERRIEAEKEETAIEASTDDQVNITHEDIKKLTYKELLKNVDKDDYKTLNELRIKLADKHELDPAHIVNAKSIMAMILFKPRTKQDFNKIHGVGEKFLNNYLEAFSELINEMYPEKEVAATEKQRSSIATYETSVPINRDLGVNRIIEVQKQILKTIKDVLTEEYEIQMVLIQNGCFFEMIEENAQYFHSEFEFKPGLQDRAGFGQEGLGHYVLELDQRNVCYAVVEQVGKVGTEVTRQVTRVGPNCNKKASKALGLIFQNV